MALTDAVREMLREVSVATLTTQMLKRGFRNVFMQGVRPLHSGGATMVGEACTLRYIPSREDLDPIEALSDPEHPQRKVIETIPADRVLVVDCRGDGSAAAIGAILIARLKARRAAGFVCDGGIRDMAGAIEAGLPFYGAAASAPPNITRHHAVDIDLPIGCGGVPVFPGDIVVGDRDGVVVLPAHLAEDVAAAAFQQERLEEFLMSEIRSGRPLTGTYPPNEETLRRFNIYSKRLVS